MLRSHAASIPAPPPALAEAADDSRAAPLSAGQGIALCVLALLTIGVVMVNSAGMSVDRSNAVTAESLLLSKSTIYMALAMLALTVVALLPIRRLVARWVEAREDKASEAQTPSANAASPLRGWMEHMGSLWPLWAFVAVMIGVLSMVYMPVIGKEVNHSHRWINLHAPGLDSVQPSEIAKWALIIAVAWFCCRNAKHMNSFWKGLIPGLAAAGAVSAFIVLEDLGTGALLGMVACLLLIAGGVKLWHLLALAPLPMAAMTAAIVTSDYRTHRILAFLNPYDDPQGIGYHMIQSMVAVANGQFFGTGLGHGLQKFGYLPEDTTDFVFAIVCEELGVFGGALVIFLYGAMLWCILGIIRREPSRFLKLVALGVMATVGLQAVINLAVVTGLGPTKGIALPLLSSGGTGWILTAASLGLIVAMDRTRAEALIANRAAAAMPRVETTVLDQPLIVPASELEPAFNPPSTFADDSRFAPPEAPSLETARSAHEPTTNSLLSSSDSCSYQLISTVELADTSSQLVVVEESAIENTSITTDRNVEEPHPVQQAAMLMPSMDVPSGQTGVLFAEANPTPHHFAIQPNQTPEVVVTDEARDWPPPVSSSRVAGT